MRGEQEERESERKIIAHYSVLAEGDALAVPLRPPLPLLLPMRLAIEWQRIWHRISL